MQKSTDKNNNFLHQIKSSLKKLLPLEIKDLQLIKEILFKNKNLSPDVIDKAMKFFFINLGFPEYFFKITTKEEIAHTIEVIHAFKIVGGGIPVESKKKNKQIYIVPEIKESIQDIEQRLDQQIKACIKEGYFTEIKKHRTKGKFLNYYLNIYIIETSQKRNNSQDKIKEVQNVIKKRYKKNITRGSLLQFFKLKSNIFINHSQPDRIARYYLQYDEYNKDIYPYIQSSKTTDRREYRIMITCDKYSLDKITPALTLLWNRFKIEITRSYSTIAWNKNKKTGIITLSYYFSSQIEDSVLDKLKDEISVLFVSARTKLDLLAEKKFSFQSISFLNAFSEFANHFLRSSEGILDILRNMIKDSPELRYLLNEFQMKIEKERFETNTIRWSLIQHYKLSNLLYKYFYCKFSPLSKNQQNQKLKTKIIHNIRYQLEDEIDKSIFSMGITFVDSILKTNFYKLPQIALSIKLKGDILQKESPVPYSIIYIYGKNFKGYHVRFQDIARGGVRIVPSLSKAQYLKNSNENFLEVFNLAYTQELKNKDIPEGGSKGIILPYYRVGNRDIIFKAYIDALLDLMMPAKSIIQKYNKQKDLIFLGPDEGTAHLMDWACMRARKRTYPYWRSFTTGKSKGLGGISHIEYGMTTRGVHEYVLQILSKLGINEENVVKVQTGGPDGDLGGNEILVSKDKTIAVIDGSGVAYDPMGLNRKELKCLVRSRKPIICFNKKQLNKKGFVYSVSDKNIKVFNIKFLSGYILRDQLPFLLTADLFVPNGGRPKTINISNWKDLIKNEKPRYQFIVEGANLFITQDARIKLENNGVLLIKDSSANKGGVLSSSLEVLAGIVLSEKQFENLMCVKNNKIPSFREIYICDIQTIIQKNAQMEFDVLWKEKRITGKSFSRLSDDLSQLITDLTNKIKQSSLIRSRNVCYYFLKRFIPNSLQKKVKLVDIYNRIPLAYLYSIVAREIAREFVYLVGVSWYDSIKNIHDLHLIDLINAFLTTDKALEKAIQKYKIKNNEILKYFNSLRKDMIFDEIINK